MSVNKKAKKTTTEIDETEQQIADRTKRIDYFITDYSIELLANKMENGDFEIPDYQRASTWESARKSRFIESILMNLPIPFLFFWENTESGILEIVDGSQRLRTIHEFIHGGLKLEKLDRLPLASGFSFKDLPESRQRKIKNRPIRGIILNEHADLQARLDLFDRINTGSKIATPAEIRRGIHPGPFMDSIMDWANLPFVIKALPMTKKQVALRKREELLVRFFAYGDGLDDYKDLVSIFLNDYTKKMNEHFISKPDLVEEYRERLESVFSFVDRIFPYGVKKSKTGVGTPGARFESITVGSYLALQREPRLSPDPVKISEWIRSEDFEKIVGADGANVIKKLERRLYFVRDKLLES